MSSAVAVARARKLQQRNRTSPSRGGLHRSITERGSILSCVLSVVEIWGASSLCVCLTVSAPVGTGKRSKACSSSERRRRRAFQRLSTPRPSCARIRPWRLCSTGPTTPKRSLKPSGAFWTRAPRLPRPHDAGGLRGLKGITWSGGTCSRLLRAGTAARRRSSHAGPSSYSGAADEP